MVSSFNQHGSLAPGSEKRMAAKAYRKTPNIGYILNVSHIETFGLTYGNCGG